MKTLTLIIPVYNEAQRVKKALRALEVYRPPKGITLEKVKFVNDGSTDSTLRVLLSWKKRITDKGKVNFPKIDIISYKINRGRGYAVRQGLAGVDTDYAAFVDADMSIPLENIDRFAEYLKKGIDLLVGSKKMPGAVCSIKRGMVRNIVGYCHSIVATIILGVRFWDFQGGFKMFSKRLIDEVIPMAKIDRWGFDMEVIFWAKRLQLTTVELPVIWHNVERGSKVSLLRDTILSIKDMFQIRLNRLEESWKTAPEIQFQVYASEPLLK